MSSAATIRELRTDFRSVKRKIEEHGEVTIIVRGEPAYVIKALGGAKARQGRPIDYYARLVERQPRAMTERETRTFWEDERR